MVTRYHELTSLQTFQAGGGRNRQDSRAGQRRCNRRQRAIPAPSSSILSPMLATVYNGEILFEEGVLEFDFPVEIHCARFHTRSEVISREVCDTFPYYEVPFDNRSAFKVLELSYEPSSSWRREPNSVVIANHQQYDLILTWEEEVLTECPNARFFPMGTTFLNRGAVRHPRGLGVFSEAVVPEDKEYSVSFLASWYCGPPAPGHWLRCALWTLRDRVAIPTRFFTSSLDFSMSPAPLPGGEKDALFQSQFHICIERSSERNYFSEKVIDAFITKTIPIYWGCPNIGDFFDLDGIICVRSVSQLIETVNRLTEADYLSRKTAIEDNFLRAQAYAQSYAQRVKREILAAL